jgi:hypothetical protein
MSCRQLQRNSRIKLDARFAVKSGTRSKAGSAELTEQPAYLSASFCPSSKSRRTVPRRLSKRRNAGCIIVPLAESTTQACYCTQPR